MPTAADVARTTMESTISRSLIEAARQKAAASPGRFVGVVLSRSAAPSWRAFAFATAETLADWYDDWVGTPHLYQYLGTFDKDSEDWQEGRAIAQATPASVTVGESLGPEDVTDAIAFGIAKLMHTPLGELKAAADAHRARVGAEAALSMDELVKLLLDQDTRWAEIIDHGRATKNPDAKGALEWFRRDWRPVLRQVLERGPHLARDKQRVGIDEVLYHVHARIYPGARKVGLPDSSFLLPDITLDAEEAPMTNVSGGGGHHGGGGGGHHGGGRRRFGDEFLADAGPLDVLIEEDEDDAPAEVVGRGHGGGGRGRGGRGRFRRVFGGDGYWWGPYPYWYDPVVIVDETDDKKRRGHALVGKNSYDPWAGMEGDPPGYGMTLPGRSYPPTAAFVGAAAPQREGMVAELAPVLAPGTGGFSVELRLDRDRCLHATICVDGQCYRGAMDLSGPLAALEAKIAQGHRELHAREDAIQSAGQLIVGALLDEHVQVACAGWWHDLTSAASGAVRAVGRGAQQAVGTVGHTLKKLKGPIGIAAATAAGAAAAAIPVAGPVVAPMAAGLAKNLVDAAAGDHVDVKQAAQNALAQAQAAAQQDPHVAQALDVAQKAVAQTTAAYHIAETAKAAASGDQSALTQIQKLGSAAAQGDPAAQQAMNLAHAAADTAKQNLADAMQGMPDDLAQAVQSSGPYVGTGGPRSEIIGAEAGLAALQHQAANAAAEMPGRVIGVLRRPDGTWSLEQFASPDDADDWFGNATDVPTSFTYAAYFDKSDALWPRPLNEAVGHTRVSRVPSPAIQRGIAEAV